MAYVEEVIAEEPIQVPLESFLFAVPDDLQFPNLNTMSKRTQATMEHATCIVEEEFPREFLHMDSNFTTHDNEDKIGDEEQVMKVMDIGTTHKEHPFWVPPPLTVILDFYPSTPPLFIPKNLDLIFDLRSQMEDQIHWDTLMT